MFKHLSLKSEAFGLDISESHLRIVKFKKKGRFLVLASFGEFPIQPGLIKKGEIKDQEALAEIIKDSILKVKGEKIKTNRVIASLPEGKAFLEIIKMPIMEKEELASAVRYEAENYIPLSIDEVYLDFQIVKPIYNHLDHLDVLITAFPKKDVDAYSGLLKKAGLKPLALETESHAVTRALVKNEISPTPVLIIDLGCDETNFIVFSGHGLRFTVTIPISTNIFNQVIAKSLKLSIEQAEKMKIKCGVDQQYPKVFEALVPPLADLSEQIKKYIVFYKTHTPDEHLPPDGKGVQKVLLCGDGANLKGLREFFSKQLKMPVELGNPWINISHESEKQVPEISFKQSLKYTTALGLALRAVKGDD